MILCGNEEPCAVRTDLGWSIVGHSCPRSDSLSHVSVCHKVVVKESPCIAPIDVIHVLESDFKDI